MELLLWGVGLLRLAMVLGLAGLGIAGFGLLVREPVAWHRRWVRSLAWGAMVVVFLEALLGRLTGRHLVYGLVVSLLLMAVAGLEPGGWLRRGLPNPPRQIGPYYFWAGWVGLLLWLRFTGTG